MARIGGPRPAAQASAARTREAASPTAAVVELAARAEQSHDPQLAQTGRRCAKRLREPLRAALVGRVSTGKSTLLNALLATDVAPTDGRECTKFVHVFRHGRFVTASVVPRNGRERTPVTLDGSRLPSELDLPASEIKFVDVTLPTPLLEQVTLIDTPGLAGASAERQDVIARMHEDTDESAAHADALLYCVKDPLMRDEADAVATFREGNGAKRLSAFTAIGLLTRADQTGGDPCLARERAAELAKSMADDHADLFSAVVPVVGLLAETAETGTLREGHARALGELAQAWDRDVAREALRAPELFLDEEGPVEPDVRRELLGLLGQYGVGALLEKLRSGVPPHAAALTRAVSALSGLEDVQRQLEASLGRRADVLKAARALEDLTKSARRAGDRKIYEAAQEVLDTREMFPLQMIDVARLLGTNRVALPNRLQGRAQETLMSWLTGESTPSPRVTGGEAARAVRDWQDWAQVTDLAGRRVARVMVRAWQLAAEERR